MYASNLILCFQNTKKRGSFTASLGEGFIHNCATPKFLKLDTAFSHNFRFLTKNYEKKAMPEKEFIIFIYSWYSGLSLRPLTGFIGNDICELLS